MLVFQFLRRAKEEYDSHLLREHHRAHDSNYHPPTYQEQLAEKGDGSAKTGSVQGDGTVDSNLPLRAKPMAFRPNALQQGMRVTLGLAQFVVGYFVLLLIMSWNVWIFLCIGLGWWVGEFVFDWRTVNI